MHPWMILRGEHHTFSLKGKMIRNKTSREFSFSLMLGMSDRLPFCCNPYIVDTTLSTQRYIWWHIRWVWKPNSVSKLFHLFLYIAFWILYSILHSLRFSIHSFIVYLRGTVKWSDKPICWIGGRQISALTVTILRWSAQDTSFKSMQ